MRLSRCPLCSSIVSGLPPAIMHTPNPDRARLNLNLALNLNALIRQATKSRPTLRSLALFLKHPHARYPRGVERPVAVRVRSARAETRRERDRPRAS